MSVDERGFDSSLFSLNEFTHDELKAAYRSLAVEFSKQSVALRMLKIENRELRQLVDEQCIPASALGEIRKEVLSRYLQSLPKARRRRGAPTNVADNAQAVEAWSAYSAIPDPKPAFKSWLRSEIEASYKTFPGVSPIARKKEIGLLVSKIATRVSRLKSRVT